MIRRLRVEGFALLEALDLELGPGLTVLSGGSGDGKTLVVDALRFLCGGAPRGQRAGRARRARRPQGGGTATVCGELGFAGEIHARDVAHGAPGPHGPHGRRPPPGGAAPRATGGVAVSSGAGASGPARVQAVVALTDALRESLAEAGAPAEVLTGAEVVVERSAGRGGWASRGDPAGEPHEGDEAPQDRARARGSRSRRERCAIGGVHVSLGTLRAIGARLVEVHEQGAAPALAEEARQRDVLDRLGGVAGLARTYGRLRARALARAREHDEVAEAEARLRREDARSAGDREALRALAPRAGEYEALRERGDRLEGRAADAAEVGALAAALGEDEGAILERLRSLVGPLRRLGAGWPDVAPALEALEAGVARLDEAQRGLARVRDGLAAEPWELEAARERLRRYADVARRLGVAPERLAERWEELGSGPSAAELGERREALGKELERTLADLEGLAGELGAARRTAAGALTSAVQESLAALGLGGGTFDVSVAGGGGRPPAPERSSDGADRWAARLLEGHPFPWGRDRTTFLFAADRGAGGGPAPLGEASGGELGRLLLAIGRALGEAPGDGSALPLVVFDEVDQNVGARLGAAVGQCLARMGRAQPVLAVTHLAAVAACADRHLRVVKRAREDGRARSEVEALAGDARLEELALMIRGAPVTPAALVQARELLAEAEPLDRTRPPPTRPPARALARGDRGSSGWRRRRGGRTLRGAETAYAQGGRDGPPEPPRPGAGRAPRGSCSHSPLRR